MCNRLGWWVGRDMAETAGGTSQSQQSCLQRCVMPGIFTSATPDPYWRAQCVEEGSSIRAMPRCWAVGNPPQRHNSSTEAGNFWAQRGQENPDDAAALQIGDFGDHARCIAPRKQLDRDGNVHSFSVPSESYLHQHTRACVQCVPSLGKNNCRQEAPSAVPRANAVCAYSGTEERQASSVICDEKGKCSIPVLWKEAEARKKLHVQ